MAALITALFGIGGFALACRSLGDNSFLWHLRTGGLILDNHGVPHRDPFSFTAAGTHWIAQSWLAEVMYAALSRSVGDIGIRVAVGLAGACVAVALFRVAYATTNDRVRALAIGIPALGSQLHGVVRAPADVRPGALERSRVHGRGSGVVPRSAPAVRHTDRDVSLGEPARHVLAGFRVPRRVLRRPLARRCATDAGSRARAPHRYRDRRRARVRQSVRAESGAVPDRAHGPQPGPEQRRRVAVGEPAHADRLRLRAVALPHRRRALPFAAAAQRPADEHRVPAARLVGGAEHRDRGGRHDPDRRTCVPARARGGSRGTERPRQRRSWSLWSRWSAYC